MASTMIPDHIPCSSGPIPLLSSPNHKLIPPSGIISLSDKQVPTFQAPLDLDAADADDADAGVGRRKKEHIVTRGIVDVSAFKEKLLTMPSEYWEDECQQGNVRLIRPSHDKWGIKKIIFHFCDDYLMKVLDLPWSFDPTWTMHLDPIYASIGVDKSKIVRCLLASIPPGVSIPLHHDTGFWVKHTHRIHVPIVTGEAVYFFVGHDESSIHSYQLEEGRIIELNNQAKHAVINNLNSHRIHLIFDYVDDFKLSRYALKPGQHINQTRRTIDFAPSDRAEDQLEGPRFLIIGAQKSGTTSLYEYICQHPLVIRGKRRETHFFDWRWNAKLVTPKEQLEYYLNYFEKDLLIQHPSLLTGESTPSYLLHSDVVIPRVKEVLPHVKVLAIFRNPVDRAFSQYQMAVDMVSGTPEQKQVRGASTYIGKTFEEVIAMDLAELKKCGINADSSYEDFKQKYLKSRPFGHGGHSLLARGMYALQLTPWVQEYGCNSDRLMILSINDIKGGHQKVQDTMNRVFEHIGIPPEDIDDSTPKNTRNYQSMTPETRKLLEDFYAPYNQKLWEMLGKQLEW